MFSHCASSQISSIDSYSNVNQDQLSGVAPPVTLDDEDSFPDTDDTVDTRPAGRLSVLDVLSFSSDESRLNIPKSKAEQEKAVSGAKSASVTDFYSCIQKKDLKKTRDRQKQRITRDAMGAYIPPPGGAPLTRSFAVSPGPAAYYPKVEAVKVSAPACLLKFRHKIRRGNVGPGPAAYMITEQCCPDTYNENHCSKRFEDPLSIGPGPAGYDLNENQPIGKCKPKAIILSRPKDQPIPVNERPFRDTYGFTRFGKVGSPCVVLVSRPFVPTRVEPGPGAYDPQKLKDTKIGILIKGRPPGIFQRDTSIPGPEYLPPDTLSGPAWSLVGKHSSKLSSDSPGPIYKPGFDNRKPLSMTFRPFSIQGLQELPGPLHYRNVGDQYLKNLPKGPSANIISRKFPDFGLWKCPGPNQYFPPSRIGFSSYNECSMKGFRKSKTSVTPGPADYNVPHIPPHCRNPPSAIIPHKYKQKPSKDRSPGCKYDPTLPRGTVRNVFLSPRWKSTKSSADNVPFYDLTGFTKRGKTCKIPISFKSRQSPFVYQGVASTTSSRPVEDMCNLRGLKYEKISDKVSEHLPSKIAFCT
ncbi:unnamed protein product [Allacma fusca]|uniref:Sperm-tail PG-rich repeat-containing protein 2 n=1 Tax=Allacma fusca TaxID=39272 RepID=A0A8J2LRP3_9HEXA|nr:unnamed protein product [Allacma fusca]